MTGRRIAVLVLIIGALAAVAWFAARPAPTPAAPVKAVAPPRTARTTAAARRIEAPRWSAEHGPPAEQAAALREALVTEVAFANGASAVLYPERPMGAAGQGMRVWLELTDPAGEPDRQRGDIELTLTDAAGKVWKTAFMESGSEPGRYFAIVEPAGATEVTGTVHIASAAPAADAREMKVVPLRIAVSDGAHLVGGPTRRIDGADVVVSVRVRGSGSVAARAELWKAEEAVLGEALGRAAIEDDGTVELRFTGAAAAAAGDAPLFLRDLVLFTDGRWSDFQGSPVEALPAGSKP